MSKCSTRRESEALAVFNVLVNVEELLEVSAKKSSKLHVGRVDRLMDHASEPLAGLPHVGVVEQPEVHEGFVVLMSCSKKSPQRAKR